MARAIGMKRSALVGAFATEGFLYALTASLLGTLAGVGLGRALVASKRAFSSEHNQLDLYFTVKAGSLAQAFVMSFAVAVLAIVIMSVRVSRLNIIRAIRDIAEPPTRRRRRSLYVGVTAVVLGGIWTIAAAPAAEPFGLLLGPTLVLIGLAPALGRIAPSRSSNTAVAALVVGWSAVVFGVFPCNVRRGRLDHDVRRAGNRHDGRRRGADHPSAGPDRSRPQALRRQVVVAAPRPCVSAGQAGPERLRPWPCMRSSCSSSPSSPRSPTWSIAKSARQAQTSRVGRRCSSNRAMQTPFRLRICRVSPTSRRSHRSGK